MSAANIALLERIRTLKAEHPAWGYRRIWAYLTRRQGLRVNHKRVHRLMARHGLLVPARLALRANRTPLRHKPRTVEPNRIWGTDMTKIMTGEGWAYLHVVLDWGSKKIVGCTLARRSRTADWLAALDQALNRQFPGGIREAGVALELVSDNGSQPTAAAFGAVCATLGINQIFASYNNPKGNADTERVIRTLKDDLIWPREWPTFAALEQALPVWVRAYNEDYPHAALGYDTPYEYERWFLGCSHVA